MEYYWLEESKWGKGKPPARWEAEIINEVLVKIEGLSKNDSEAITQLNQEISQRFLEKVSRQSVKNSYSRLHKAIRIHFTEENARLTENNSIYHPTKGIREHFGCTLIDTPDEIKAENMGLQRLALDWKQHSVATLEDPELIVNRGRELIEKGIKAHENQEFPSYLDLSVGIALLAGLRVGEILRDARLEPCSPYTIMLTEGQAKTRGKARAYEMPTLIEAETVLKGYLYLRETFKADQLTDKELEPYKNKVRFHVELHFGEIIPTLSRMTGEKSVNPQRLRAVYDAIAVFYYCPPDVQDFVYIKGINGHEPTAGKSEAAMYYLDYQIGDEVIFRHQGKRQGVKLNQPGVKVIEAIAVKQKEIASKNYPSDQKVSLKITLSPAAKEKFLNYKEELKASNNSEVLMKLLEVSPKAETVKSDITPSRLGLTEEWAKRLETVMEATGQTDLLEMVSELIKQEIKFREGMRTRHQGKDFSSMPLSQLKRTRHPLAAAEKVRRAFLAIKYYNSNVATERAQRWYINANTIHKLVGGRFAIITPWCEAHHDEIESHNQTYELTEVDNRKSVKISEVVTVPEMPID